MKNGYVSWHEKPKAERTVTISNNYFLFYQDNETAGKWGGYWVFRPWQKGMGLSIPGSLIKTDDELCLVFNAIEKLKVLPRPGIKPVSISLPDRTLFLYCHGTTSRKTVHGCQYVVRQE